jgi:hypothetical protein
MERPAIGAGNGLNGEMFALVRASGNPGVITAFGTFEQVGAAHKIRLGSDPKLTQGNGEIQNL